MSLSERYKKSDFYRVFNFKSKASTVCTLQLINTPTGNIAHALTSGALYTAFLAENGIDIVRVGIITFIPYITWLLSFFSPMILSKFRMRQKVLLFNDTLYYVCVVLATTIVPRLVSDPGQKTMWFAVFLFLGNLVNALLGSGCSSWIARFVPEGKDLNTFTAYTNLLMLISLNGAGILASVAASALEGSPNLMTLLFWLRIVAFVLFMGGSLMLYLIPRDEPLDEKEVSVKVLDIIREPVRCKPFFYTSMIVVLWGIISSLNSGTYSYYLLETAKVPLWYQYISSVAGAVGGILLSGVFRKLTDRTSPYWVVGFFIAVFLGMEFFYVMVGPNTIPLYVVLSVLWGFVNVGFSMGYNSLFYLKIPKGANKDLYATFWNMIAAVASLVGAAGGTALLSVFEKRGMVPVFGHEFYGSQVLCMVKACMLAGMLLYMVKMTPRLSKDLKQ